MTCPRLHGANGERVHAQERAGTRASNQVHKPRTGVADNDVLKEIPAQVGTCRHQHKLAPQLEEQVAKPSSVKRTRKTWSWRFTTKVLAASVVQRQACTAVAWCNPARWRADAAHAAGALLCACSQRLDKLPTTVGVGKVPSPMQATSKLLDCSGAAAPELRACLVDQCLTLELRGLKATVSTQQHRQLKVSWRSSCVFLSMSWCMH